MRSGRLADLGRRLLSLPRLSSPRVESPGLYAYVRETPEAVARFHLRIEPDGSGLLLSNATAAARLNPSGVVIARALLEGVSRDEAMRRVSTLFRGAPSGRVQQDVESVERLLVELSDPAGQYPVMNLEDPAISPRASRLMAPFQAGITLAEPGRMAPILDRLWEIGIPHVNFRAGTRPTREHLLRAVERAEDIGMIAGARVIAGTLDGQELLQELVTAGLDHLIVPVASRDAAVHEALFGDGDHQKALDLLEEARDLGTCGVAEVPLVEMTVEGLEDTIDLVAERGITNVSFYAVASPPETEPGQGGGALPPPAVVGAATLVEEATHRKAVRYFWQPPVRRDEALGLAEQVQLGPRATGDVSIRVEPDGSVIPPRGPWRVAGNLLQQPWDQIWQDAAFRRFRERVEANTRCSQCPGLSICAADCPREPAGWS